MIDLSGKKYLKYVHTWESGISTSDISGTAALILLAVLNFAATLAGLVGELTGEPFVIDEVEAQTAGSPDRQVMEGGLDIDSFMERNRPYLNTVAGYVDIAMMIEIHALDLYLRMANESRDSQTQKVLRRIADEEKAHLTMLGRYLDERSRSSLDRPLQGGD